ncbi:MAG: glycine cleavage system aminomethyltransferase GcvT [Candidatus Sericytochromatia bacterium]|nr:glycine cleavage system aminomethyltransferase GcvT [Candidatus Sericytochromatia bacterium]
MTELSTPATLSRTPLHQEHCSLGARMVPFAGWEMPVQYSGILDEHHAVRQAAGLFDVSHMGEFQVRGVGAEAFVQRVVANDVARLAADQALYTQFTRPDGGTVDDLLVYRRPDGFLLVVNASNIAKDWAWLKGHLSGDVELTDVSDDTAMLALQGPCAEQILAPIAVLPTPLSSQGAFRWQDGLVAGLACTVARTGYTGEDGFEIFCAPADAPALWRALLAAGAEHGLKPAGLGARDTLRLEAGLPLYGHELTDQISPVMAGLTWSVKLDKGDFLGREALTAQRAGSMSARVVGLVLEGRAIARQGYAVFAAGQPVGEVLSGTLSPTLQQPIATALVAASAIDSPLTVEIRGQQHAATLVRLPFYRRPATTRDGA